MKAAALCVLFAAATASASAQDLTLTNARIIAANGAVSSPTSSCPQAILSMAIGVS